MRAGEAALGVQRAQLPRLRHQAAAEGREEGHRETEEALRRAEASERNLEAERARLMALAAERPPMPKLDNLLAAQSDLSVRFMKQARFKDGSTLHDRYETWPGPSTRSSPIGGAGRRIHRALRSVEAGGRGRDSRRGGAAPPREDRGDQGST